MKLLARLLLLVALLAILPTPTPAAVVGGRQTIDYTLAPGQTSQFHIPYRVCHPDQLETHATVVIKQDSHAYLALAACRPDGSSAMGVFSKADELVLTWQPTRPGTWTVAVANNSAWSTKIRIVFM